MYKFYQTIENEIDQPLTGTVKGQIPAWVNGSLYRNGPGMYEVGEHKFQHWFDGMAMLQRYHIADGKVTYQRKFLRTDTYRANMATKRISINEFGTQAVPDPCKNIFSRFLIQFEMPGKTDNTLVTVFPLNKEIYAATETSFMNRVHPETLGVQEKVNLEDKLHLSVSTAHPHYETDGTMYNLGQSFKRGIFTVLASSPPKKEGEESFPEGRVICKLPSAYKLHYNYFHSFSMTENYFVFIEQPLLLSIPKFVLGKLFGYTFCSSLTYYPNIKCRFRIIDKNTGKEVNPDIRLESDSFAYFHQVNAYEEQGHIVVDISCHPDSMVFDKLYLKYLSSEKCEETLRDVFRAEPRRYVFPINPQTAEPRNSDTVSLEHTTAQCKRVNESTYHLEPEVLADVSFEFPQINYDKYNRKKYRYLYGVGISGDFAVIKIDANTKSHVMWQEERCFPSEPVFIPNPSGTAEDDGVVVSAVNKHGGTEEETTCFLLMLDAKTFKELARVEFEGVGRFPKDFHGSFASDRK